MNNHPLLRTSDQKLSLWQSVVGQHAYEQHLKANDNSPIQARSVAHVQEHPLIQGANEHVRKVSALAESESVLKSRTMVTNPSKDLHAHLSELCYQIAHAAIRDDDELKEALMSSYRKYSSKDPGFLTCAFTYARYYKRYNGVLKYNPWTHSGDINYGVIDFKLPNDAKVAILGDWGTGMSDASHMLETLLKEHKPDAIIHLGDIYYSGTANECALNFYDVFYNAFKNYGKRLPVFTIPGNHDYYAFGYDYYEMVKGLNSYLPSAVQDASYFCLRTEDNTWQFLGMDTGHDSANPADELNTYYAGPNLEQSEIYWHKDKLDKFPGSTILLSHHQLFTGNAKINGSLSKFGSYRYLNKYLLDIFRPYLGNKVAAWLWGHEHNQVIFKDGLFGLPKGRLVGASAYEETVGEDPYKLNNPSVPFNNGIKLGNENGYFNHGYAILDFSKRKAPGDPVVSSYYEYPSWGATAPNPIPTQSNRLHTEDFKTAPSVQGRQLVYGQGVHINMEKGIDFISTVKKTIQQYYPTVGPIPTNLILKGGPDNSPVKHGDIIQIKSMESGISAYDMLGAWGTPACYYYKSGYDQENWIIQKVDQNGDPSIYEGDAVFLVNKSYAGQYLCPLTQVAYPGETSLTTSEKVPTNWYISFS